jgi:hypothetical protein
MRRANNRLLPNAEPEPPLVRFSSGLRFGRCKPEAWGRLRTSTIVPKPRLLGWKASRLAAFFEGSLLLRAGRKGKLTTLASPPVGAIFLWKRVSLWPKPVNPQESA